MTNPRDYIRRLQVLLAEGGFDPGTADGIWGTRTDAAVGRLRAAKGAPVTSDLPRLPWIVEINRVFGLHETRDNAALRAWLRSDGKTLGDPAALPWCGDAVETAIRNSLPKEPLAGDLGANPYWARNWLQFGVTCAPCYGAVAVFARGTGGHVGFAVGQDAASWHILGGNQGNAVNVVAIDKRRLLGMRWPVTFTNPNVALPIRDRLPQSVNEV